METIRKPLKHMSQLDSLNEWVFDNISSHLGSRVLEAGCGNGNLTKYYLEHASNVVSVDMDTELLSELKARYAERHLLTLQQDLTKDLTPLHHHQFDTVVCLNTLEHIKEEEKVLTNFHAVLKEGGKVIIQVPAYPWLYSSIDKAVGHYRRYQTNELKKKLQKAGFKVIQCKSFNFFGIFGWILNGKILRRPYLSTSLLSLFNFLLPIINFFEQKLTPSYGLSLIVVAKKETTKA
jgi:SAM-dependent methyltransferase